jgi:hypothetical protein
MASTAEALEPSKTLVQNTYYSIFGKQLDSKNVNYWANCIFNNMKTIDNIKDQFLRSEEYAIRLKTMFKDGWHYYIGKSSLDDNQEIIDAFVERYKGKQISDDTVFEYITSSDEFHHKYLSIISNTYMSLKNDVCETNVLEYYLIKFKSNKDYNINQFNTDLMNGDHLIVIKGSEDRERQRKIDEEFIKFGMFFQKATGRLPTIETDLPKQVSESNINLDAISLFEATFNRAISVQEYFKYIHNKEPLDETDAQVLYLEHTENFNKLREIFHMYTGTDIDEYKVYISKYLSEIDKEGFFENIVNTIIDSNEYDTGMKKELVRIYKNMYDETLEEPDVEYLFTIVKKSKVGINDDKLHNMVSSFKSETDFIVQNVFQQYVNVVEREPDMYEIEQHVSYYRKELHDESIDTSIDNINKYLQSYLMKSLEFHDIIKKKIKSTYKSLKNKEILPSVMFDNLNRVIANIETISFKDVDNIITNNLNQV